MKQTIIINSIIFRTEGCADWRNPELLRSQIICRVSSFARPVCFSRASVGRLFFYWKLLTKRDEGTRKISLGMASHIVATACQDVCRYNMHSFIKSEARLVKIEWPLPSSRSCHEILNDWASDNHIVAAVHLVIDLLGNYSMWRLFGDFVLIVLKYSLLVQTLPLPASDLILPGGIFSSLTESFLTRSEWKLSSS